MVRLEGAGTRDERGFTLIEMMIVVAVIAILAVIVVPQFTSETRKTKASSEVTPMFAELTLKLEAAKGENNGRYPELDGTPCPSAVPSTPYDATTCTDATSPNWDPIGFQAPESKLRCQYAIQTGAPGETADVPSGFTFTAPSTQPWYWIYAECDSDGQGGTNSKYFATSVDPKQVKLDEGR